MSKSKLQSPRPSEYQWIGSLVESDAETNKMTWHPALQQPPVAVTLLTRSGCNIIFASRDARGHWQRADGKRIPAPAQWWSDDGPEQEPPQVPLAHQPAQLRLL
jgi:hypothetical protein